MGRSLWTRDVEGEGWSRVVAERTVLYVYAMSVFQGYHNYTTLAAMPNMTDGCRSSAMCVRVRLDRFLGGYSWPDPPRYLNTFTVIMYTKKAFAFQMVVISVRLRNISATPGIPAKFHFLDSRVKESRKPESHHGCKPRPREFGVLRFC